MNKLRTSFRILFLFVVVVEIWLHNSSWQI